MTKLIKGPDDQHNQRHESFYSSTADPQIDAQVFLEVLLYLVKTRLTSTTKDSEGKLEKFFGLIKSRADSRPENNSQGPRSSSHMAKSDSALLMFTLWV